MVRESSMYFPETLEISPEILIYLKTCCIGTLIVGDDPGVPGFKLMLAATSSTKFTTKSSLINLFIMGYLLRKSLTPGVDDSKD